MPPNSQAALAQLQETQAQSQNPNDILSGQRQQLGVQGAQDTVTGLRGAINNTTKLLKSVAPSVMGRTANSLVTAAQAGKQIQNEQAPISQTLTDQGSQYTEANQDLSKLEDQAGTAAAGIYQGQQDKQSYLQNLYNSLYQREQTAAAAQQAEADRQEQIRQFNASLAEQQRASKASAAASSGNNFNLGGAAGILGSNTQKSNQVDTSRADSAINDLLHTNNKDLILKTISAITTAANKGSAYDKYKLQQIAKIPEFQKYTISNYNQLKF